MSAVVRLIAKFVAKPARADELQTLLAGLIETTRGEQGCVMYQLWRSQDRPGEFSFVEEWTSEEDLQRHLAAPHLQHAAAQLDDLLEKPLELRRFDLVG
ncbi:MAG: antibiotic biosynthesis monooxygenase [Planctomycetales bacterium]|nr:antibiotic biosynthesis monooxygenase [Planctomycetales bacterium]